MTGTEYDALYDKSPDKASRALFDEYCKYVYTIVFSKLHGTASKEDIEECVSDIFAEIYFKYNTGSSYPGRLDGYIATVAKRRAINRFKHLSKKYGNTVSVDDESMDELATDNDTQTESEREELSRIMLEKIEILGEPDSTIILQKYYYGRSTSEIAGALSMKISTVSMRCSRALKKLSKLLEGAGITP